jgi:hypothetical protein
MRWDVVLERRTVNRLNPDITRKRLARIVAAVERNKSLGFTGRVGKLNEPEVMTDEQTNDEVYRYRVRLQLEKEDVQCPEGARDQYEQVLKSVSKRAEACGWTVQNTNGEPVRVGERMNLFLTAGESRPAFEVPSLTDEVMEDFFEGVYERDEHIRVLHDAVVNHVATLTAWKKDERAEVARSHILLKGKPAGAKTTLFERFKKWYETASPGAERVTFVDMQTATKAGIENWLLDRAEQGELADIVVFEELEKLQPLDNLLPLVSVMGSGHISKLNARVGHRRQLANVLVWATCNDEHLLRRWRNGAIWSRFSKALHCGRPSRVLMKRILLDTIERTGGDPGWADQALAFAYDVLPQVVGRTMEDPREIKGLLDGRDRLLDFSYQNDLVAILKSELKEERADRQVEGGPVW